MNAAVPPDLEGQFQRIADEQRRRSGRSRGVGDHEGADDQAGDDQGHAGGQRKQSQATKLVDLGRRTPLFHDPEGNAYATVPVADHDETWRLRSPGFRSWIARQYWQMEGTIPRAGALQDALTALEGLARFDGRELVVHLRHAHLDGALYVDLGDPRWRAIEITAAGWRVVDDPPVKFRRPRGMLALPEPVVDRSHGIEWLQEFLNITDEDAWRLVVGFLLGCYAKGPFPVLVLNGEQGSAKSTAGRVIRWLVDPARTPDRSAPRDERDLIIAANNGHVVSFDNLSSLRDWQSDGLARLATGAGFGTRELYTDAEETLFWAAKPIILNGITDLAVRSDLLDRSLLVTLPRIPDDRRLTEERFWETFQAAAPAILGSLLDAVSASLGGHRSVRLGRLPRMADFAVWVIAAEPAIGWDDGSFLAAYSRNRASAHELALESASIVPLLHRLPTEWTGTAGELLEQLVSLAGEKVSKRDDWPANPRALAGQLRRLAPDLRSTGVEVTFNPRSGQRRSITITRAEETGERPSSASSTSSPTEADHPGGDGRDGDDGLVHTRSSPDPRPGPDPELPANDDGPADEGPALTWEAFGWSEPPRGAA
jgi:hypothetical protein